MPDRRAPAGAALLAVALLAALALLASAPATAAADDPGNVTVYRSADATYGSAAAVEAAVANGSLERTENLVIGETLVASVESERLAETMRAGTGTTTKRFLAALADDATFRLVQTNQGPQVSPLVATVGPSNVTAQRDGATTYVVVDTGELAFHHRGSGRASDLHGGERFAVRFGHDIEPLSRTDDPATVVGLHDYESAFFTTGPAYEPLAPEWVQLTADVNVPPEESVVVRLTLDGERTRTATMPAEDIPGFGEVWLDLRDVEPGTPYVLELVHDGAVTDRYEGTVREPTATVETVTQTEVTAEVVVTTDDGQREKKTIDDHVALVADVSLSHGGKVQVFDADCDRLGTRWVDPDNETRVTVRLWDHGEPLQGLEDGTTYRLHIRTVRPRGDGEVLYTNEDAATTIRGSWGCEAPIGPETPAPNATPSSGTTGPSRSPTTAPPESPTRSPTAPPHSTPSVDPTTVGGPGFGLQVGVLALAAALPVFARRP